MSNTEPDFGSFAPSRSQQRILNQTHRLPYNYAGRKLASLLLGPAGGRSGGGHDVCIFETQKARLHPSDNVCEKRVYVTPQHWEPVERAELEREISSHNEKVFYFLDVGANVGLYTFFVRAVASLAGKALSAVCIEPDPEMRRRLEFNRASSGAEKDIQVFPYAAAAADGQAPFAIDRKNRGMSRIDGSGDMTVDVRTLKSVIAEAGMPRIDAMKIDIEGQEFPALDAFFKTAAETLWPRFVLMETAHEDPAHPARDALTSRGYAIRLETRQNGLFKRE